LDSKEIFQEFDKANFEFSKKVSHRIKEGVDSSLGHAHIYLLMFLKNEGECMVTDIAKHLCITLSAVTNLTDKLHKMGLIERNRRESDRRVVAISLKEDGEKVLERIYENRNKIFNEYFDKLTNEEIETFIKIIKKISENVGKIEGI